MSLFEEILANENMNGALRRVKRNRGAPGIDGMTVEEVYPWLLENVAEFMASLREERYTPSPVRRKEIPKPDGGVRKLGIPTVLDRLVQQAIAQKLNPIFEPLFHDGSYGYRPGRKAQDAIQKVVEYAKEGYCYAVSLDLSKYFDTLNHELLMDMLHRQIKDKQVLRLIKKFLRSGVMENGMFVKTEEGSPQGGPLSPLLANIYLNEFDWEMSKRGVKHVRYADDIVVLARSKRAADHLLESCRKFLEGKLKLKVNVEKSKATYLYAYKEFKFLGFCLGKDKNGAYVRIHPKSQTKAKKKLIMLTKRNRGCNVRKVMNEVKIFIRGWLGYYYIARIKSLLMKMDGWLRRRLRMYIWKQWKKPKARVASLIKLGISKDKAYQWGNTRKGYWRISKSQVLHFSITNKRLIQAGYYDFLQQYEQLRYVHSCD